jgi:hypothetical protein
MSEIRDILNRFKKENIDFCILRNYKKLEITKDIDILINSKDKRKIKKIAKEFGLKKGVDFGYYLSCKNLDKKIWLDFKIGCLSYQGFCFESSENILNRKKKYSYFYILSKEDEFIHLILHSIINKGFFKERYIQKIEELIKNINRDFILNELTKKFDNLGKFLFLLIKKKKYNEALKLKKRLMRKIFGFFGLMNFLMLKIVRILR